MNIYYNRLVKDKGEEGAKLYMKELRSKVKKPGIANSNKATRMRVSKMGIETREKNAIKRQIIKEFETSSR